MSKNLEVFLEIAENAFHAGRFQKVEVFLKRAERAGYASKDESETLAVAIENLATAQLYLKKFSTAIASYERALKQRKVSGRLEQESCARLCYKLAEAHFYNRNYFRCEQYLKQGWEIDQQRELHLNQLWRLIVSLHMQNKLDEGHYYRELFVALRQQQSMISNALCSHERDENALQISNLVYVDHQRSAANANLHSIAI